MIEFNLTILTKNKFIMKIPLINYRNYLFVISLCFLFHKSNAQPFQMQMYYDLGQNSYPHSLTTDGNGAFYFVEENINPYQLKKVTATGVLSTIYNENLYIQNNSWNIPVTNAMASNPLGDLYFANSNNWPTSIIKLASDETVSTLLSDIDNYPTALASDPLGNLYFINQNFWPSTLNKIDATGTLTVLINDDSAYYISEIIASADGNLYFTDDNTRNSIYKITAAGEVSLIFNNSSNLYQIKSLAADGVGNVYILDGNSYPRTIYKVDINGSVELYATGNPQINEINRIISDVSGRLFFLGYNFDTNSRAIFTVSDPASCVAPLAASVNPSTLCYGTSANLIVSAIGEIKWYDTIGGTLLATGSRYDTPPLTGNTSYFVQSEFCGLLSPYAEVKVVVEAHPVVTISGLTTNNDVVTLTASGNAATFLWSGGTSPYTATNYFTRSGSYQVTITNEFGCSDTETIVVTVNKLAVTSQGSLTTVFSEGLDSNGKINANTYLNRFGKLSSSLGIDEMLSYEIFSSPLSHPNNAVEFSSYTNPANLVDSGIKDPLLLLNWNNGSMLTNAGIVLPSYDGFSVVVSGFFVPQETGNYIFTCEGDDAVDLFVNGINVANHYGGHGLNPLGTHIGTIALTQGVKYDLRVRMQENGGGEGLRMYWKKPSDLSQWVIDPGELSSE